jgi:pullulanase
MNNTFFEANLIDKHTVKVTLFSENRKDDKTPIFIFDGDNFKEKLEVVKQSFFNGLVIYECKAKSEITLGRDYHVAIASFGLAPLIVSSALDDPSFDSEYYYDGDDLGATYSRDKTNFKLRAPLASEVYLLIKKKGDKFYESYPLSRGEKGVYSLTLRGNYDGFLYRYKVKNNGLSFISIDPYAKASNTNGHDSVVVDLAKTKIAMNDENIPLFSRYMDAIIYELNVRDFTIDSSSDIVHKGKYLGLSEKGRSTLGKHPAGLDYLKFLNITHVQLLPIQDFATVDEANDGKNYNRGYDPKQYFVPEGSYSTDPDDPYARIVETKQMISALHAAGIRVNLDVVYNHVYDYLFSSFEKIVPNYYFRKKKSGMMSDGSFCGNDLDTARPMVRKLMLDSVKYRLTEYDVDGFRFDLMGIIDIDTMKEVVAMVKAIKPNAMIYGEGWDMPTELTSNEKSTILNSFRLPNVAFFNDTYRDMVRGPNEGSLGGYLSGNLSYIDGFEFAYLGSALNHIYQPRFLSVNQSVNYVECHDNRTLFDKIKVSYGNFSDEDVLSMVRMINYVIGISFGIAFYHAGQEIGLSKFGMDNTYNMGDKFNKFYYDTLDKRFDMALGLSSLNKMRNIVMKSVPENNDELDKMVSFERVDGGALKIIVRLPYGNIDNILVVLNTTSSLLRLSLDNYYKVVLANGGASLNSDLYIQSVAIDPHSVNAFVRYKNVKNS